MKRIQRELEFQLVCLNLIKQGQGPIAQENVPSGEERGEKTELYSQAIVLQLFRDGPLENLWGGGGGRAKYKKIFAQGKINAR